MRNQTLCMIVETMQVFKFLTLYHTIPRLIILKEEAFENIMGKGRSTDNKHLLLFSRIFQPFERKIPLFSACIFYDDPYLLDILTEIAFNPLPDDKF